MHLKGGGAREGKEWKEESQLSGGQGGQAQVVASECGRAQVSAGERGRESPTMSTASTASVVDAAGATGSAGAADTAGAAGTTGVPGFPGSPGLPRRDGAAKTLVVKEERGNAALATFINSRLEQLKSISSASRIMSSLRYDEGELAGLRQLVAEQHSPFSLIISEDSVPQQTNPSRTSLSSPPPRCSLAPRRSLWLQLVHLPLGGWREWMST